MSRLGTSVRIPITVRDGAQAVTQVVIRGGTGRFESRFNNEWTTTRLSNEQLNDTELEVELNGRIATVFQ